MSQGSPRRKPKQYALRADWETCIGCGACAAACKMEHDLPAGPRTFKIVQIGPVELEGHLAGGFQAVACFHCERPACVAACPTGAMQKREDGLVFSDRELCIGCRTCAVACPFGIPELNPATGKIAKCNGCMERVDAGLQPSCVLACPAGALSFGPPERVAREMRRAEALRKAALFTDIRCLVDAESEKTPEIGRRIEVQ